MYFIVETLDQLNQMQAGEECFVQLISGNDKFHPKLSYPSLLYYNDGVKGYIFPFKHSESFSLDIKSVQEFLSRHKTIFLIDKKYHSYFLDLSNTIDINFIYLDQTNNYSPFECESVLQHNYYSRFSNLSNVNEIIPISKHYERCQCLYDIVKGYFGLESDTKFQDRLVSAYKSVEQNPIRIDEGKFKTKYQLTIESSSKTNDFIYSYYNLYNLTGRPTNSFNGINFLAIPKDNDFRDCFIPKNTYFVEFDFEAYHLRLIGTLIGYDWGTESIHNFLGKQYFDKDTLTENEYAEAKTITFRQLYGGVLKKYKHIRFFSLLDSYINNLWETYKRQGAIALPTSSILKFSNEMNKLKLFNYMVQNLETLVNVDKIERINQYLNEHKLQTKLVLITYDAFLFDFDVSDGKELLLKIKEILEEGDLVVKHKHGINYSF